MNVLTRRFAWGAALLFVVCSTAAPSLAHCSRVQTTAVPKNQGWVTDLAGMLDGERKQRLEQLMESYKQGSKFELALLTVPNLGGVPLETYALDVGRAWGIGAKSDSSAALLLIARDEHKIRIEVGRGLEGTLTDSICGRIIRDVIAPRFKQGKFGEGIEEGIKAMQLAAGGKYGEVHVAHASNLGLGGLLASLFGLLLLFSFIAIASKLSRFTQAGARSWRSGGFGGFGSGGFGGFGGFGGGGSSSGGGGGFSGFGGGGGFSGGGASGGW